MPSVDHVDRLRGHAFVVDLVGAEQRLAWQRWWCSGSSVTFRKSGSTRAWKLEVVCALGARGGAHLGPVGFDVGDEERVQHVGGCVAAEQDGAVVVLGGDHGRIAQGLQALEVVDDAAGGRPATPPALSRSRRRCHFRGSSRMPSGAWPPTLMVAA